MCQKSRKLVIFALNYNKKSYNVDDLRNIDLISVHDKEYNIDYKDIKEIQTIENGYFQSHLFDSSNKDDNEIDYMGYLSKHRDYIYNMLNTNEMKLLQTNNLWIS